VICSHPRSPPESARTTTSAWYNEVARNPPSWSKNLLEIVLTEEQAQVVTIALRPVQVRDRKGNVLGTFTPVWTEAHIAEAKRRLASNQPGYSLAEVLDYLQSQETHAISSHDHLP
jgi:hypothetical protein